MVTTAVAPHSPICYGSTPPIFHSTWQKSFLFIFNLVGDKVSISMDNSRLRRYCQGHPGLDIIFLGDSPTLMELQCSA